jgi:hypothetical protein
VVVGGMITTILAILFVLPLLLRRSPLGHVQGPLSQSSQWIER